MDFQGILDKNKDIVDAEVLGMEFDDSAANQLITLTTDSQLSESREHLAIKSSEVLSQVFGEIGKKFGIDVSYQDFRSYLNDPETLMSETTSFDLAASRVAMNVIARTKLKGIISQSIMVNRCFDLLERTMLTLDEFGEVAIEMVSRGFEWLEALARLEEQYKRAGVDESLKELSKNQNEKDGPAVTQVDISDILKTLRERKAIEDTPLLREEGDNGST